MRGQKFDGNNLSYAIEIVQDVIVPKAQDSIPFALDKIGSYSVSKALRVLTAVCFHDQPAFVAYEIDNERPNWLLTPELCAGDLAIAQNGP